VELPVVPFGKPRPERADAARNRERLLETARAMIAEHGTEKVTMDALAEQAGLGKGTVFRRFGTRAGIFRALLDDDERRFQEQVLTGPPPLGPGADPAQRLIAYGHARTAFLADHYLIVRASLERREPRWVSGMTLSHIRMLLGRTSLPPSALEGLTVQLTTALEGPFLLPHFLTDQTPEPPSDTHPTLLSDGWRILIERLVRD